MPGKKILYTVRLRFTHTTCTCGTTLSYYNLTSRVRVQITFEMSNVPKLPMFG
jgi:hypothetical protein